ncbi:hypothetical protein J2X01_004231 [Arthrobacter ginsengisoli]|uniref:Uncharacterized protein n=1 Tax=Arthrobacter ginsengisoli TaxID=1356565 RepID=A0ABU1UI91_9MICC|nr:hypothetical protein [Arthrobacter ginsengisoli]MDR7084912.1 hypothetical protein [Arthrobacter ginsengisoli]
MQGVLAPVHKDQWWDHAQPNDIAQVHTLAVGWKDHDPAALAASERVQSEVQNRYGIDTRDVGTDAAYLESGIETISAEQARREAVAEHRKGMALRGSGPLMFVWAFLSDLLLRLPSMSVQESNFGPYSDDVCRTS